MYVYVYIDIYPIPLPAWSGRCLSFDAQAAGYVLGECSISVVLKPYAEKAWLGAAAMES